MGKSKAWISLQISTCPAKNAVWVDVSVQYFTVKYPCGRRNRNINNTNRGRNSKSTNLRRQRSHMLIPASRIKVTIFSDNLIYKFSTFRSFWLRCFSLSIWIYRTIYASDLKQEVKLSFCFTVFDQVVMNKQNSNM